MKTNRPPPVPGVPPRTARPAAARRRLKRRGWVWGVFPALLLHLQAAAADTNAVLAAWLAAQTHLRSWTAEFTQTRTLKTLTQPLVATGRLWFATPNRFRWELGSPAQTIAVRNADEMFVIYPRLRRAEKYPLGGNAPGEWRDMLALLDAGFPRDRADLDARFRVVSLVETRGAWQVGLQPKSAFARKIIPEIRVGLATNSFALTSTELVFADGSRMRNDFTNGVLNPSLEEKIFDWQPDPDFKITEPMAR
jgi:outer membrane lipoprotein-sorting protein